MRRHGKPWWLQTPALIAGGIAAFGTLGTFIVKSALYISLPEKVLAAEAKNDEQDTVLTQQTAILTILKDAYQQDVAQRQEEDDWYWDEKAREWKRKPPKPR